MKKIKFDIITPGFHKYGEIDAGAGWCVRFANDKIFTISVNNDGILTISEGTGNNLIIRTMASNRIEIE